MGRERRTTTDFRVKVVKVSRRDRFVLRWTDPITGQRKQEVTKHQARRAFRRLAEREARDKEEKLAKAVDDAADLAWEAFCIKYSLEHLAGLAVKTKKAWNTANEHVKEIVKPQFASDLTAQAMSNLAKALRMKKKSENTIACYLRTVKAALRWGEQLGIVKAPATPRIKRARGIRRLMRSRPVTAEEYERMLKVVPDVRPDDPEPWKALLEGLWKSGLRLEEAMALSWKWESPFSVQLSGEYPMFKIHAEAEKGHQDRLLPMAPEFAEFLLKTPKAERRGRVFRIRNRSNVGRVISSIGKKAGVKVAPNKFASAHDLRRSFGTRWAKILMPAELKDLMRHRSIDTTMGYYVEFNSNELARKMRQKGDQTGGAPQNSGESPDCQRSASQEHTTT